MAAPTYLGKFKAPLDPVLVLPIKTRKEFWAWSSAEYFATAVFAKLIASHENLANVLVEQML